MAPNETGVLWMIRDTITAPIAGKPMATRSGAATAAGVPNPAEPSINDPKRKAMIMAWTRRSGEMRYMLRLIVDMAPLSCSRFNRKIAPMIMYRIEAAVNNPSTEAAEIWARGTFHTRSARIQVTR